MPATKTGTTFGLRDVQIALRPSAPATTPTWIDIPGVESAAFKLDVGEVEQWGDDVYLGTWYHSQKGSISVKGNMLSLRALEVVSGNTVFSAAGTEKIYIGTDLELTPPRIVVKAQMAYRSQAGVASYAYVYWFNCDVKTIWETMPGGERAKLGELTLMINSYASTQDEKGDTLAVASGATTAFGRLDI